MITIPDNNKQKRGENFYEIRNHSKPNERADYDNSLDHLARLYYNIGDYTRADLLNRKLLCPGCVETMNAMIRLVNLRML
jgi:hypothetical protein